MRKYLDAKNQYDAKAARYEGGDCWKTYEQYCSDMEAAKEKLKTLKLLP